MTDNLIIHDLIVLTDLDDTLMTTSRKASAMKGGGHQTVIVENSAPERNTVQTPAMKHLEALLRKTDCYVPITGRTLVSAEKVLDGKGYDILYSHFGGFASVCESDKQSVYRKIADSWNDFTCMTRAHFQGELISIWNYLNAKADMYDMRLRRKINYTPDERPNELVFKFSESVNVDEFQWQVLKQAFDKYCKEKFGNIDDNPFFLHVNGNNFSIYLKAISKQSAAKKLLSYHDLEQCMVISAGDSFSDLSFMSCSDVMIIPTNSQIGNKVVHEIA